jgi:uncharacterized protein YvpB
MSHNFSSLTGKFARLLTTFTIVISLMPTFQGSATPQLESNMQTTVNRIALDFENLTDLTAVTTQYSGLGVTFAGATILSQGGSLNYLNFPPRSGRNVIYDTYGGNGVITITFNPNKTGNISKVGGYITGNRNITMTAFDTNGNVLGSASTGGPNYDPVGIPNMLLEITSATPITRVEIRDGGNTFTVDDFFFENEQLCQIANVPLFKQGSGASWANDPYGGTSANPWRYDDDNDGRVNEDPKNGINDDGDTNKDGTPRIDEDTPETIAKWGCALTSAAMVVSYYGARQTGRTTNPRELNNWLKANSGYSGGSIKWDKVAEFARDGVGTTVAKGQGIAPQFYSYNSTTKEWQKDDGVVNTYLCNMSPVILETHIKTQTPPIVDYSIGHYVVATGQAGNSIWNVNDPGGYNLLQLSSASYDSIRKYSDSPRDLASLYIAVHSPVELLITDPAGRKTGYDPTTGQYLYGIVDATYGVETIGAQDGTGTSIETRVLEAGSPISGTYSIQLVGIGNGYYEVDFTAYDTGGNASHATINGVVDSTSNFTVTLGYSTDVGSQINVTQPPGKIYLPIIRK